MSISFASLKHLNLPISTKIPVAIWQIVLIYMTAKWERSGSVVECLTRDPEAAGSSLTVSLCCSP